MCDNKEEAGGSSSLDKQNQSMNDMENEILYKFAKDAEDRLKEAELINEKIAEELSKAEEFLEYKGIDMLEYEKQIFLDLVNADGLVVCGK